MKPIKYLTSLVCLFILVSCSNNDSSSSNNNQEVVTKYAYNGNFVSSAHTTSGVTKVSADKTQLIFETFKTDSGPNLNIYLASSLSNIKGDYIDLGDIKGVNGNYTYTVTSATDFSKYKYIVVWCVDFNVNFGYSTLAP